MFTVAFSKVVLAVLMALGLLAFVGFGIFALVWFARAISGKDDTPQRFPDGPQVISEDD